MTKNSVTLKQAAIYLNKDVETLRLMLQQGLVQWGSACKLRGSSQYVYVIYPEKFSEITGYKQSTIDVIQKNLQAAYDYASQYQSDQNFHEIESLKQKLDDISDEFRRLFTGDAE